MFRPLVLSLGGLAIGLGVAACDLDMKDLGDESESAGDDDGNGDTGGPGGQCEPGDQMMADDGCNTCSCTDDGQWACTALGCDPTQGATDGADSGGDGFPPGMCEPGDTMPADDGCNTCTCDDSGLWACTAIGCEPTGGGECTPGDTMPADDGCNTCTCGDDSLWACTEIACAPQVNICEAQEPDYATIVDASIVGDDLLVSLSYGGGCEDQTFQPCWDGLFAESLPVQTWVALSHSGAPDPCDAIVNEDLSFSLLPMRQAYEDGYQTTTGTITLHLDGWGGALTYSW
jgi:hypothetical protein